jgi:threonine/homoserine/homoserine lactone efflux protein
LCLIPGPALLYIVARSISDGRKAGLVSSLGVASGGLLHVGASVLGLSALLASSAFAFRALQGLGAAYLLYLGLQTLLKRGNPSPSQPLVPCSLPRTFLNGLMVQLLNPKVGLFFLAFLPQFVDGQRETFASQTLFLGLVFVAMALLSDSTFALLSGSMARRLTHWAQQPEQRPTWPRILAGSIYLLLGALSLATGPKTAP